MRRLLPWWWRWLPGFRKTWKLEKRRVEALSSITGDRLEIELMAQRPRKSGDILDVEFLGTLLKRFDELEAKALEASQIDDLDDLMVDAEQQARFAAYLCPVTDIQDEGDVLIELLEVWGISKIVVKRLREAFGKKLEKAETQPETARSALHLLRRETDEWGDYADDYEETMRKYTRWLFWVTSGLLPLAMLAFHFASRFPPCLTGGLLMAGAAGSCASVMIKMPALDVSLAGEMDAYGRRIWSRVGIGFVASLIGCATIGWLPISIQNQTFAEAVNTCSIASCSGMKSLMLLGFPMLLGFSERTLTSFEQRVFGSPNRAPRGRAL